MAIYSYGRVSSESQIDNTSLSEQRQKVEGYAAMNGWRIDQTFEDPAVSGSVPLHQRPGGAALLDTLQPGDHVIVAKLDRAFRSAPDALQTLQTLKQRGVGLHCIDLGGEITGSGVSGLVFSILAAVADFERGRIAERITEGKRAKAAQGKFVGGSVPFGFIRGKDDALLPCPQTHEARQHIEAAARSGRSARSIHTELVAQGVRVSLPTVAKIAKAAKAEATERQAA